jgi:hypothetical protein
MLLNSRPWEGFFLCLPVAIVLLFWLCRRSDASLRQTLRRFLIPLSVMAAVSIIFFCYYNWRGTGRLLVMTYIVNEKTYVSTPTLLCQKASPPLQFHNPQFNAFITVGCATSGCRVSLIP